jgi:hydrogenase maturation protease
VIGVGNEWRRDDAAGLVVVRRLRDAPLSGVRLVEHEGEPLDLIEEWSGAGEALVVDAVSSGAEPGTIHRLDAVSTQLPAELFRGSTHAFSVAEAVELARALERLPRRLRVYGVEGRTFTAGSGLTAEVVRAVDTLVGELRDQLEGRA